AVCACGTATGRRPHVAARAAVANWSARASGIRTGRNGAHDRNTEKPTPPHGVSLAWPDGTGKATPRFARTSIATTGLERTEKCEEAASRGVPTWAWPPNSLRWSRDSVEAFASEHIAFGVGRATPNAVRTSTDERAF